MKKIVPLTALAAAALVLSACGSAPSGGTSAGGSASASAGGGKKITACAVLDTGGVDDKSFNQSAWKGMQDIHAKDSNVTVKYVQSQSENDYQPNLEAQAGSCDAIIGVGGLLADAVKTVAAAHPDKKFLQIDAPSSGDNVYGLTYFTEQSGFLGGYLAASLSKTGAIGTYGGINVGPPVNGYMDGFLQGANYYNKQKSKSVKVLGWTGDPTSGGTYAGAFNDPAKGRATTEALAQQGADIVFPVAGSTGTGSLAAAQASGGKLNVMWVDVDGCLYYTAECQFIPTSVTKAIPQNVGEWIENVSKGSVPTGTFIGTLKNDGTGISKFNQWDSKVPAETKSELDTIKKGIIDGSIEVTHVKTAAS